MLLVDLCTFFSVLAVVVPDLDFVLLEVKLELCMSVVCGKKICDDFGIKSSPARSDKFDSFYQFYIN